MAERAAETPHISSEVRLVNVLCSSSFFTNIFLLKEIKDFESTKEGRKYGAVHRFTVNFDPSPFTPGQ